MEAELLKESVTNMASELMIDIVSSLVLGVGEQSLHIKELEQKKT